MTIEECYKEFDGDYQDVISRLITDARVEKFALRFLDTQELSQLETAMSAENWDDAFLAAHTLKGIALNLGFSNLAKKDSELTEVLRPRKVDDIAGANKLLEETIFENNKVVTALKEYKSSLMEA